MATTKNDADFTAPQDYADLYQRYFRYVVHTCSKLGIDDTNKEDVASEILLRFMERGSLENYDPDLNFEHLGELHHTKFRTYLTRAIILYTRGHRERIQKRLHRERPGGGTELLDNEYYPQQVCEDHSEAVIEMVYEEGEAEGVRALLAQVPRRNVHDLCDLPALYDAVRVQVNTYGKYDINRLREKFGVSLTAMHSWMWWLRENLAEIYGIPVPARRPRRLRTGPVQP